MVDIIMPKIDPRLSVAPMMNWTDRHCRVFHRLLSKYTLLYSEMITTGAIIHGSREDILNFSGIEHPVALQLGGSDPAELMEAAKIGVDFGYDEINLNLGCPSDRVQSGCFGAALMKEPQLVYRCISQIKKTVTKTKVTAKCRLGVDEQRPELFLPKFLEYLIDSGVDGVIIHARKALLKGLTPKQNRDVPSLNYGLVTKMKNQFPQTEIVINGGIDNLREVNQFIDSGLDGAMIGRAAYQNPNEILLSADSKVFEKVVAKKTMKNVLWELCNYIEKELGQGVKLSDITRHILGAFNGLPGARQFRQTLSESAHKPRAGLEVVRQAIDKVLTEN